LKGDEERIAGTYRLPDKNSDTDGSAPQSGEALVKYRPRGACGRRLR
jgi:hypothetical protein